MRDLIERGKTTGEPETFATSPWVYPLNDDPAIAADSRIAEAEASGYRRGREEGASADVAALLNERDIISVDLAVSKAIRSDLERRLAEASARQAELEATIRTLRIMLRDYEQQIALLRAIQKQDNEDA